MQLKNNKAGDALGLQAEMYKACVKHAKKGETCELVRLITTVQKLWRGDEVSASWLDSILIPLYRRKGTRNDWNNWRGISLFSTLLPRSTRSSSTEPYEICRANLCPKHKSDSDQNMDPLTVYL